MIFALAVPWHQKSAKLLAMIAWETELYIGDRVEIEEYRFSLLGPQRVSKLGQVLRLGVEESDEVVVELDGGGIAILPIQRITKIKS